MSTWTIIKVDWDVHAGEEFSVEVASVAGSRKLIERPDAELSHQMGVVFADATRHHKRLVEEGRTAAFRKTPHPYCPYVADGKVYPRIEIVEEKAR